MDAANIIDSLRAIRSSVMYGAGALNIARCIEALEHEVAGTEPEDFGECPIVGYDTVLSYLSREHPEAFDLIDEPVHGTITDGLLLARKARSRGIPVLRVTAPAHMQRRFPKAKTVNAYPTSFLAEHYGDTELVASTVVVA
jgi:hypothetical protein